MVGIGKTISVGGLNGLTGGLGQTVLNISASDLGDGVAVLNLDGDNLDLGVVNAMLGGDLTASVLHSGDSRVGNSVGNRGNVGNGSSMGNSGVSDGGSSKMAIGESSIMRISLSISLSFSLVKGMVSMSSVTQNINDILADLLVFNLLGLDGLGGAHVLGGGGTGLGDQDLVLNLAVGGSHGDGSGDGSSSKRGSGKGGVAVAEAKVGTSQEGGVSLSISRGCAVGDSSQHKDSKKLVHVEIIACDTSHENVSS